MNLYAVHDASQDWMPLIRDSGMTGYAIISESIGDDADNFSGADYTYLASYGVTPIVRLNYSHGSGTIPLPNRYPQFAARCANYVSASLGCRHWIIGNEPNWSVEWPQETPIAAHQYADCFMKCRSQIKQRSVPHEVIAAAIAPYNKDAGIWCIDYFREMLGIIAISDGSPGADGLALHTYSRGGDPASIYSEDKMESYPDCYNGFRAYRDFLNAVPAVMRGLPTFITETNQIDPWADTNSGWVRNAYDEINDWNQTAGNQIIHCLALYRWENYDRWVIKGKNGVIDDFKQAIAYGYSVPDAGAPWAPPFEPHPPDGGSRPWEPEPTPPTGPEGAPRDIDPALAVRGVTFDFVTPAAGTGYWRIIAAEWLDEQEAIAVGPDHHGIGEILRDGVQIANVPILVTWPSGSTTVYSKPDDPNASFNWDYPLSPSLNEFSFYVNDGAPSDKIFGVGMGAGGNPNVHTSTWCTWSWTEASDEIMPIPPEPPQPPVSIRVVHPLPGCIVTQHMYQNREMYEQFGLIGHNGTDMAGKPIGTPVACIAVGKVVYSDSDRDYGYYVRVQHDELGICSFYAHLNEAGAPVGKMLRAGEPVGLLGSSGNSTGAHLHLEIRRIHPDGSYAEGTMPKGRIDPASWMVMHGVSL